MVKVQSSTALQHMVAEAELLITTIQYIQQVTEHQEAEHQEVLYHQVAVPAGGGAMAAGLEGEQFLAGQGLTGRG